MFYLLIKLLAISNGRSSPRSCSATSRKFTRRPVSSGPSTWASS